MPFVAIARALPGDAGAAVNSPDLWIGAAASAVIAAIALLMRKQKARLRESVHAAHERQGMLRAVVDRNLDGVMFLKARRGQNRAIDDFELIDLNDKAAEMLGSGRAGLLAQRLFSQVRPVFQSDLFERCVQVVDSGQAQDAEVELRPEGGAARWIYEQIVPIGNGVAVFTHDISARKKAEIDLRCNASLLQSLVDSLPLLVHVKSLQADSFGQTVVWNHAAEEFSGYSAERLLDHNEHSPFSDEMLAREAEEDSAMLANPTLIRRPERRVHRPDGSLRYLHSISVPLFDAENKVAYILRIADDVTAQREAELALRASEARLRTIADTMPAMVAYIDAGQVYRFYNIAYRRDLGQASGQSNLTVLESVGAQRYAVLEPYIVRALQGETVVFEEYDDSNGTERTLAVTYIPQRGEDGKSVVGFHLMRQDITSQKREKKHLLKLAHIDSLTGLTNRAGFMKKLDGAMRASAGDGDLMALMFMDIDRFKPVNDTYGHAAGDQLLKAFAGRLTHALRATDTVARLGGDEFTIVMEKIARREDASAIADKIVAAMRVPFVLDGVSVSVSASVGVAFYDGGAIQPEALLQQADMQLYQAKEAGRDTYRCAALAP